MPIPPEYDNVPSNFEPIKIGKAPPRTNETLYNCTDPDGNAHIVAQCNIRDWERRGAGWKVVSKYVKPSGKVAAAPEPAEDDTVVIPNPPGPENTNVTLTGEPNAVADVLSPLNDLRARAAALGIVVDQRWGLKRLTKEIESVAPSQE